MEHRATRWLAPSLTTLPLSARRCRVRNVLNGATAELSADQHAVLTACDGCRTIDEHAVVIQRKLGLRDTERTTLTQWLGVRRHRDSHLRSAGVAQPRACQRCIARTPPP